MNYFLTMNFYYYNIKKKISNKILSLNIGPYKI